MQILKFYSFSVLNEVTISVMKKLGNIPYMTNSNHRICHRNSGMKCRHAAFHTDLKN